MTAVEMSKLLKKYFDITSNFGYIQDNLLSQIIVSEYIKEFMDSKYST